MHHWAASVLRGRGVLALLVVGGVVWAVVAGGVLASGLAQGGMVDVRGRVVNGTEGFGVPDDLAALMLITGADGALAGTGQAVVDADGGFVFEDTRVVVGGSYTLSVDYEGVFYGLTLAAADLVDGGDEAVIAVYEATEDAGIMVVDRQVMVITGLDAPERMAAVTEFVRFRNPTDRTLKPNLETAGPGRFSFMRFALPPGAVDVAVQSDLRGGEVISVGSGFALTAAVPPGEHRVDFAYRFPYGDGAVAYRNSLPQGAGIFQILVPERWDGVEVSGLSARPPVGIQEAVYRAWEGRDIPAGQGVGLRLEGLPQPGVLARVGGALSGGGFWLTAIPAAMGAALLGLLLVGLVRRGQPAAAYSGGGDGAIPPDSGGDGLERRGAVAAIAALDDSYERGELDESEYRERRGELAARALGLGAGDVAGDGGDGYAGGAGGDGYAAADNASGYADGDGCADAGRDGDDGAGR